MTPHPDTVYKVNGTTQERRSFAHPQPVRIHRRRTRPIPDLDPSSARLYPSTHSVKPVLVDLLTVAPASRPWCSAWSNGENIRRRGGPTGKVGCDRRAWRSVSPGPPRACRPVSMPSVTDDHPRAGDWMFDRRHGCLRMFRRGKARARPRFSPERHRSRGRNRNDSRSGALVSLMKVAGRCLLSGGVRRQVQKHR